jgi:hypothetical protein
MIARLKKGRKEKKEKEKKGKGKKITLMRTTPT